jgi:hypothetical protein
MGTTGATVVLSNKVIGSNAAHVMQNTDVSNYVLVPQDCTL